MVNVLYYCSVSGAASRALQTLRHTAAARLLPHLLGPAAVAQEQIAAAQAPSVPPLSHTGKEDQERAMENNQMRGRCLRFLEVLPRPGPADQP